MQQIKYQTVTSEYLKSTEAFYKRLAGGEDVEIELCGYNFYVFSSELGCMRLFYKIKDSFKSNNARVQFSKNRNKWYFAFDLETPMELID